jgi:hypothetical protein
MGITQQDLEQAFSGYKDQYSGKKEDYFALLYLTREFEKTPDQVARHIAFGQETPEGINAFHIDVNRRNLYLFQFQWSVRYQTLLRKKTARAYGDEGKAAGCVPLAVGERRCSAACMRKLSASDPAAATLGEGQKSECASGEARGGGGLGTVTALSDIVYSCPAEPQCVGKRKASSSPETIRTMDLWDTIMIALVIESVIAFCFWARIRATGDRG